MSQDDPMGQHGVRGLGLRPGLFADVAAGVAEAAIGPVRRPPGWVRLPDVWWKRLVAVVVAFAAVSGQFLATIEQLEGFGVGSFVAPLVAAAHTLPLLAVVAAPLLAARWLALGLLAGLVVTPGTHDWPWPGSTMLLLGGVLYLVATVHSRRTAVGAWVLATVVVLGPAALLKGTPTVVVVVVSALLALVMALGDTVRDRRAVRSRLASATAARREVLARQAVLEERTRIARELHDVVAHHMSLIAVQAEAAPLRYTDLSPEVARTFAVIRDASRAALGEMRLVVGALRNDDDVPEHAPAPEARQVEHLVEASRRTGMDVALSVTGAPRELPAAVDSSVYRLVQEALSNARRHAPGAAVRVELGYHHDRVTVRVVDDGGLDDGGLDDGCA